MSRDAGGTRHESGQAGVPNLYRATLKSEWYKDARLSGLLGILMVYTIATTLPSDGTVSHRRIRFSGSAAIARALSIPIKTTNSLWVAAFR